MSDLSQTTDAPGAIGTCPDMDTHCDECHPWCTRCQRKILEYGRPVASPEEYHRRKDAAQDAIATIGLVAFVGAIVIGVTGLSIWHGAIAGLFDAVTLQRCFGINGPEPSEYFAQRSWSVAMDSCTGKIGDYGRNMPATWVMYNFMGVVFAVWAILTLLAMNWHLDRLTAHYGAVAKRANRHLLIAAFAILTLTGSVVAWTIIGAMRAVYPIG